MIQEITTPFASHGAASGKRRRVFDSATIGEASIACEACTANQGFQSFIVNDSTFSNEYLYYWLLANKKHFLHKANGSTFLEISKSEIKKIPLCTPDIQEQQKIAAFLSAVDTKIEQLNSKKSLQESL